MRVVHCFASQLESRERNMKEIETVKTAAVQIRTRFS